MSDDELTAELAAGQQAAEALARHMVNMGGAGRTEFVIPVERGSYRVTVSFEAHDWDKGLGELGAAE